ncbi:unnamed protein product [Phytomonas sp. Hart1]|nr:unnamed protein product [Phytomonas sp. Hart1]|eukprot:CCW70009.1 unnamed protein product [Phytomonas sp. isolate Hart1]
MLWLSRILRGVSPFSIFLMDQKNNPALKGISIASRAQVLSKMYNELPQKQRRDLQKRAKAYPSLKKKVTKTRRTKRPNSDFSNFVKANYNKVKDLNYKQRFSALSQLYELQKPVDLANELKGLGLDDGKIQSTLNEMKKKGIKRVIKVPKVSKAVNRIKKTKNVPKPRSKSSTKK